MTAWAKRDELFVIWAAARAEAERRRGVDVRPADAAETAEAWRTALTGEGPTALVLSRQALPPLPPTGAAGWMERDGGRLVHDAPEPDVDLLASGSEVALALGAAELLAREGVAARVWSVPCRETFLRRRTALSAPAPKTVAVEAGTTSGWRGVADAVVGVDRFGASGPGWAVAAHLDLTVDTVARAARSARSATPPMGA